MSLKIQKTKYSYKKIKIMQKIILIFILIGLQTNAQTNLDSLYNVWQDKTQTDSIRSRAFIDYIWDGYLFSQPDSAFILAEELKQYVKKNIDSSRIGVALYIQANSFYLRGNYDKAIEYHMESLKLDELRNDKHGVATSFKAIGLLYSAQGNYTKALNYHKKSLKINRELNNDRGIASSLNNIGNIYSDVEDYDFALKYLFDALELYKTLNDKLAESTVYNNIGNIFRKQKLYKEAQGYLIRSITIKEAINDLNGKSYALNNLGSLFLEQDEFDKAEEAFNNSLQIRRDIGDVSGIGNCLMKLGEVYLNTKRIKRAISVCYESKAIAEDTNKIELNRDSCNCLYNAYKALKKGNTALQYHEQMLILDDSLQTEETVKKLQHMEFEKQVLADSLLQVEKELKVEMAHQTEVRQKNKNKNLALVAGVFFLLLSGGFYSRWRYVKKSKAVIEKEKDRSDNLLLNILPSEIAEELKAKGSADARDFEMVSILFTDFKGFTQASEKLSAKELIEEINVCFKAFDQICEKYGIEKIKTIGDAYMAAGGLPVHSEHSLKNTVLAALEMQAFISKRIIEKDKLNEMSFKMRLGIHTGPVVAGIVGVKKFQYDIWGDTVNTASRMESSGSIGKVNISESTYLLLKDDPEFAFKSRGKIDAKGKGEVEMYYVSLKEE
jgi:class 3 adenylate cyclase/uncharacterized protein HemY